MIYSEDCIDQQNWNLAPLGYFYVRTLLGYFMLVTYSTRSGHDHNSQFSKLSIIILSSSTMKYLQANTENKAWHRY